MVVAASQPLSVAIVSLQDVHCKAEKTACKLKMVLQFSELTDVQVNYTRKIILFSYTTNSSNPLLCFTIKKKRLLKELLLTADILQISIPCCKDYPGENQVTLNKIVYSSSTEGLRIFLLSQRKMMNLSELKISVGAEGL